MSQHQGGLDRRTALQVLCGVLALDARFQYQPLSRDTKTKPSLTIDLGQWEYIVVKFGSHEVPIPPSELFASLTRENTP